MTDDARGTFLDGERPEAVAIYVAGEALDDPDVLDGRGTATDDGRVFVLPGEGGRRAFAAATGENAMDFAKQAMGTTGDIDRDIAGGTCPNCGEAAVRYLLAFVEEQNEDLEGMYAEGDVVHAYARCECGTAFSDKWIVDD